jgi:ATP-dependent Clp protease ATP-binding subunit ClpC
VYPFERFTADAKRVLTLAQEEAERSHHSYIGTEHILLGILRLGQGIGPEALTSLGIEIGLVRETIEAVLVRNERIIIQQIIPTSRVKKVIEIAFEEARRMDQNFVNSGHLLLGLVIEGEGIAAHVLEDLGAGPAAVIASVETLMGLPLTGAGQGTRPTGEANRLMQHPRIVAYMRGKDLAEMKGLIARLLDPPQPVVDLRAELAQLRSHERDLRQRLQQAEDDWLRSITE